MDKDIYKNPILYYILVPLMAALWLLLLWGLYLPQAHQKWKKEKDQYIRAQDIMAEILNLDPERLAFTGSKTADDEFDYAAVVEQVARSCKIPSAAYKLTSRPIMTTGQQKSQSAQVALKSVNVKQFSQFLSTIQLRWANLQCTKLKLAKKKGTKDTWNIDLEFKYYY